MAWLFLHGIHEVDIMLPKGGSNKEPNYIRNLVQALPDPDFAYTG